MVYTWVDTESVCGILSISDGILEYRMQITCTIETITINILPFDAIHVHDLIVISACVFPPPVYSPSHAIKGE